MDRIFQAAGKVKEIAPQRKLFRPTVLPHESPLLRRRREVSVLPVPSHDSITRHHICFECPSPPRPIPTDHTYSKRLFKLRTFDSVIQRSAAHQLARQQGLLSTRDGNLRQCLGSVTSAFNHGAVDVGRGDRFAGLARGTGAKLQCSSETRRTVQCGGRGCPTVYVRSFSRPKTASHPLARKFWASSFPKISIRPATTPVHPV